MGQTYIATIIPLWGSARVRSFRASTRASHSSRVANLVMRASALFEAARAPRALRSRESSAESNQARVRSFRVGTRASRSLRETRILVVRIPLCVLARTAIYILLQALIL